MSDAARANVREAEIRCDRDDNMGRRADGVLGTVVGRDRVDGRRTVILVCTVNARTMSDKIALTPAAVPGDAVR